MGRPAPSTADLVLQLAVRLRRAGVDVSTSEVVDACSGAVQLDMLDRSSFKAGLRACMVKEPAGLEPFDRVFDDVFGVGGRTPAPEATGSGGALPARLSSALQREHSATTAGEVNDELRLLAAEAVEEWAGMDDSQGSTKYFLHRVLRAADLSRMLSATMQQLRAEGRLTELELLLKRNDVREAIEEFRRLLAAEIAERRRAAGGADGEFDGDGWDERAGVVDRDVMSLSHRELVELRRAVQPLARQLAARIGRRRRSRPSGRLDVRRTLRRSIETGGVPIEPRYRRHAPRRPRVVLLCDLSGSVADFSEFTFLLVNAIHDVLSGVRSFAFVGGVTEMTDLFAGAVYELPVGHLLERPGVLGLDGHSDYGTAFARFADQLDRVVGPHTTLLLTGDGRTNYRDPGVDAFRRIAARAHRVYWLNPEPVSEWDTDDSMIAMYRPLCDGVFEVRSLRQLSDVVAQLV